MKKILALILALTMCALCFAACDSGDAATTTAAATTAAATDAADEAATDGDLAYVQNKGKMIVGITDYAPMNYKDEAGNWTGFDTEFTYLVAEKLGVEVEFVEIVWATKAAELETKNIDCVWNGMTITDEVKAAMDCSNPYVINAQVLVAKADMVGNYKTFEDLKDVKFVAERGSAGSAAITEAGFTPVEVDTQAKALMEVANGTADACVIDITMANAMTGEGTDYANLASGLAFTVEEYGIGFRKGSDMVDAVNAIIAELKADGTLEALAAKYELTLAE